MIKIIIFNSLPWNQHTVKGWAAEALIGTFTPFFYFLADPTFLTLFISICEFHRAFYEIFRVQMDALSMLDPCKRDEIKASLYKSILFHASVKKSVFFNLKKIFYKMLICRKSLFQQTADIYSIIISIQLIGSMISLACCIFEMDLVSSVQNISIKLKKKIFKLIIHSTGNSKYENRICFDGICIVIWWFKFIFLLFVWEICNR